MSSERDLQNKLDEMEADINQNTSKSQDAPQTVSQDAPQIFSQIDLNPSPKVQGWIDNSKAWFNSLPKFGKAGVAIAGVWVGFSIVGAVLHVVSSVLTIGAIGLLVYVGYRLFANSSEDN